MTPKLKAKELFLIFKQIPPISPYTGLDDGEAKQCALIAVNEIIDSCPMYYTGFEFESNLEYWQEVITEIKKL